MENKPKKPKNESLHALNIVVPESIDTPYPPDLLSYFLLVRNFCVSVLVVVTFA
jgi:hypothetical protein